MNRLAKAGSPYLLQHADNPVDWYEWGEEALAAAKAQNKVLIISIGYAACHWCHVMAHESFSDDTVAAFMNEHFISVKVDREERPDIDSIYMDAAQLISGSGGWPLNAFALPDGRPFYAGTYFTKEQWLDLLKQVYSYYTDQYSDILKQAEELTKEIQTNGIIQPVSIASSDFSKEDFHSIFTNYKRIIDREHGGFYEAPKFPLPIGWEFLLEFNYLTGNAEALEAVTKTLDEMAKGGIYDQIGGGFARYSVDQYWKVPHFEKMLYDNAQLVSLYAHAFLVTHNPRYAEIINQTLDFIERELMNDAGGFYSSLNADSEGEEGRYYVWTREEIINTIDPENADLILEYYGITSEGNWEKGINILFSESSKDAFAKEKNMSPEKFEDILNNANAQLFNARNNRIKPDVDDKVLTSWNALMLKGYIDAFRTTGNERFLNIALNNTLFLRDNMIRKDGSLWRNYKNGTPSINAFLDDYAFLSEAFIELYEITFDKQWLDLAKSLADHCILYFHDANSSMFFYTSNQSETLIARKHEITDNVIPSSNSAMANVLFKLGHFYDNPDYISISLKMLSQIESKINKGGPYYANWAKLLGLTLFKLSEIAVMGDNAVEKSLLMQKHYLPASIFAGGKIENLPILQDKNIEGRTMIFVCKDKTCRMPSEDVSKALEQIIQ